MANEIEKLYSSKDYCFQEINQIRAILGDKAKLSQEAFDAAIRSLGLMYIHCPKEITHIVWGQMNEVTVRERYFQLSGLK